MQVETGRHDTGSRELGRPVQTAEWKRVERGSGGEKERHLMDKLWFLDIVHCFGSDLYRHVLIKMPIPNFFPPRFHFHYFFFLILATPCSSTFFFSDISKEISISDNKNTTSQQAATSISMSSISWLVLHLSRINYIYVCSYQTVRSMKAELLSLISVSTVAHVLYKW